jgi:translation initiation factor IF-2
MAEAKQIRLNKVLREFNISLDRAVEFLNSEGYEIEARPTTKISNQVYQVLSDNFETDKSKRVASKEVSEEKRKEKEEIRLAREAELQKSKEAEAAKAKAKEEEIIKARERSKLARPKQVGKIDLDEGKKKKEASVDAKNAQDSANKQAISFISTTKTGIQIDS